MSDFDRNMRDPVNQNGLARDRADLPRRGFGSSSVVGAAIVAVLILIAVGYVFSDRATTPPTVTHPAATTTTTPPATAPAPAMTPAPATTPPASPAAPAQKP